MTSKANFNRAAARLLIAWALLGAAPVGAEVDGHQLLRLQQEYDAYNAAQPKANQYRAGAFSGYLSGMLDALEGRSVCFKVCRCEIDAKVAAWLREHPTELDRPVAAWLVPLLERDYPCPK